MFIEFDFGNFRSFRDMQKFSMEASPLRSNDNGLQEGNVFEVSGLRLLKSKAVFGRNASGKSNLLKAWAAFCLMVRHSVAQEDLTGKIWDERFKLITNWDDQPIFFQYIFLYNGVIYRYGFQILSGKISYEWLYSASGGNEVECYMRIGNKVAIDEPQLANFDSFLKQAEEGNSELFRDDSLFLTAGALNGNKLLAGLRDQIKDIFTIDGIYDADPIKYTMNQLIKGPIKLRNAIKTFLTATDTNIGDLELGELLEELKEKSNAKEEFKRLFSHHSRYDENGALVDKIKVPFGEWESEGTWKLFGLSAIIFEALEDGKVIVIDEYDARLHPNISLKIIELFHSSETNPKNAQIIFVTHDSGLLRRAELRRDQICFVDKDRYGVSQMTNLVEYKGVRKDASYEKEYLSGNYNGVPYLDKMDSMFTPKKESDGL
jgi:AAA15 family ATPase/GTPase